MTTPTASLEALSKTSQALQDIQRKLKPLIEKSLDNDSTNHHQKALAQAAIALSIGTLRVMKARLQGSERGKDDPLRNELNRIRAVFTETQKLYQQQQQQAQKKRPEKPSPNEQPPQQKVKR